MDVKAAREAIEAILAAIPDDELPKFDRIEYGDDDLPTAWIGGRGYGLGSAKSGTTREPMVRDPLIYRRGASDDAIEMEAVYRADRALFENGDKAAGVKFRTAQRGGRT